VRHGPWALAGESGDAAVPVLGGSRPAFRESRAMADSRPRVPWLSLKGT
jgi:hypothetical protein